MTRVIFRRCPLPGQPTEISAFLPDGGHLGNLWNRWDPDRGVRLKGWLVLLHGRATLRAGTLAEAKDLVRRLATTVTPEYD